MMRSLLLAVIFFSLSGVSMATEYSVGQIWSYKTRAGEESSTVLINKIDIDPKLGKIFHISVRDVHVINKHAPSGVTTDLPHFPVSEIALEKSFTKLAGQSTPNPEYLEGYRLWREAFDANQAGVFDVSVAEIVGMIEQSVSGQ
jgi:hypothetical protein